MPNLPALLQNPGFSFNNSLKEHRQFFESLFRRAIISLYLLRDRRVELIHKVIPIATLIYILSPLDLLPELPLGPLGMMDDLFLMIFAVDWFVQLAPAEVVLEVASKLGYVPEVEALPETVDAE
jgi:uncharacterized membrane protein YkvA (DUF1232 family)